MGLVSVFVLLALYCYAIWADMKDKEQRKQPEDKIE